MISEDDFKYTNFDNYPNSHSVIKICSKHVQYAITVDTVPSISASLYQFSKGYFYAADSICTRMLKHARIDELDTYIFPLFFLYRHSIELLLKCIAFCNIPDKEQQKQFISSNLHDLKEIYLGIVSQKASTRPKDECEWLEQYFDNISAFDKASDSFRYPFRIECNYDWSGKTYSLARIFQKQTHLDLINEANKFEAAYEILDAWYQDIQEPNIVHNTSEYIVCNNAFLDEGGSYYEQSVVGFEYHHDDFCGICSGYHECANFLQSILKTMCPSEDRLLAPYIFYPMCYLYRNTIELYLKAIILEFSNDALNDKCEIIFQNKHKIPKLLETITARILPLFQIASNDQFILDLSRSCDILHNLDSDSSLFRYPVNKHCSPYFKRERSYDSMEIGNFLDAICNAARGINGELSYRKEIISEMEAEYCNNFEW